MGTVVRLPVAHLLVGMIMHGITWWFEHDEPGPDVLAQQLLSLLRQGIPATVLHARAADFFGQQQDWPSE